MTDPLIGVWKLIQFSNIVNGTKIDWPGPIHGHLIYTECGFVSVAMNRFKLEGERVIEHKCSFYSGTYQVLNPEVVQHNILESHVVERIGQSLKRKFWIEGEDQLKLSGEGLTGPVELVWQREGSDSED